MNTLVELLDANKESEKIAIVDRRDYRRFTCTYKRLHELCMRFVGLLDKHGVKKGDRVMVWAQNGLEYVIVLLGSYMAGVIVVPVDMRSDVALARSIDKHVKASLVFQTRIKPRVRAQRTILVEELLDEVERTEPGVRARV
ncbi:MAG: class I adenylate-forming enzyme family protein, partial [Nanoarchaeota archaeon]